MNETKQKFELTEKGKLMLRRLMLFNDYGGFELIPPNEECLESSIPIQTKDMPPWILHQEDIRKICALRKSFGEFLTEIKPNPDAPDQEAERMRIIIPSAGASIVGRLTVLIFELIMCYNYYGVPTLPYPGTKPSRLLDPVATEDLREIFFLMGICLYPTPVDFSPERENALSNIYTVMNVLLDMLTAWLPCPEVSELRARYQTFHMNGRRSEAFEELMLQFAAVSRKFAESEPQWELERAAKSYSMPTPNVPGALARRPAGQQGGGKDRKRYKCSNKQAARFFVVDEHTIENWRRWYRTEGREGTRPPAEFPRGDVPIPDMRYAGEKYQGLVD